MMRLIIPVLLGVLFFACGNNNSTELADSPVVEEVQEFDSNKYDMVDLTGFGLPAQIQVPNKSVTNVDPEVELNEASGTIEVSSGEKFKLQITETEMDKSIIVADLKDDLLFKNTITEEEDNFIKYTSELPDGSNMYTHFCAWINIGDVTYMVENVKGVDFSDHYLNRMIKCVKSIQLNNSI